MEINRLNTSPIDDKYWEVLEEYSYETSKGLVVVPKGFRTDYASVPKIFRNIINLSLIHILMWLNIKIFTKS